MGDLRRLSHAAGSTEGFPQPQVTKEREPILNQRNKMKTSGDHSGGDGSQDPSSSQRVRSGGIVKRRRSSQAAGFQASGPRKDFVEKWLFGTGRGVRGEDAQPAERLFSTINLSGSALDDGQESPDNLPQTDDMSLDVLPSSDAAGEPNVCVGSSNDPLAGRVDSGTIDDVRMQVDTGLDGLAAATAAFEVGGISGFNQNEDAPARPSDDSTLSNVSMKSGYPGNRPAGCEELKIRMIDTLPLGIIPGTVRRTGFFNDLYGFPIYRLPDLDQLFTVSNGHGADDIDEGIDDNSIDVTRSIETTPYDYLLQVSAGPVIRSIVYQLPLSVEEGHDDAVDPDANPTPGA